MNINGHEVERREGPGPARVYVDGEETEYIGTRDPDYYIREAEGTRVEMRRLVKRAEYATLIAEFIRREAAEREAAEQRTRTRDRWRALVRALDADTATREAQS